MYRVLFHLAEDGLTKTAGALSSIRHALEDLGPEGVEIELLANGDGVLLLLREPNRHAEALRELAGRGVRFAVCRYSMRERGIVSEELLELATPVPSGPGELARRQAAGWLYIRL